MSLLEQQLAFLEAIRDEDVALADVHGRLGVYRFAYFERLRLSIEEDLPLLFEYLETIEGFPGELDSEAITRDLLVRNPPHSWTLAEASLPIRDTLKALLSASHFSEALAEALRLVDQDEAEGLASWLEEWPESKIPAPERVSQFAAGNLLLARTKTWRETGDRIFWRAETGVSSVDRENIRKYSKFLELVISPVPFLEFAKSAHSVEEPGDLTEFLRDGIAAGWLRLTDVPL